MATTREKLRELIEHLPDEQLERAARLLSELSQLTQSFDEFLASAPLDDEPTTDDDRAAIAEGREDDRSGRTIPLSNVPPRRRPTSEV